MFGGLDRVCEVKIKRWRADCTKVDKAKKAAFRSVGLLLVMQRIQHYFLHSLAITLRSFALNLSPEPNNVKSKTTTSLQSPLLAFNFQLLTISEINANKKNTLYV